MSTYLEDVPVELLEIMISYLDLSRDIENLITTLPKHYQMSINWSNIHKLHFDKYTQITFYKYLDLIRLSKRYDDNIFEIDINELLNDIFEYLLNYDRIPTSDVFEIPRYYESLFCSFESGYNDPDSEFEYLSNHLDIGVVSQNKMVGNILLRLLKYVVDTIIGKKLSTILEIQKEFQKYFADIFYSNYPPYKEAKKRARKYSSSDLTDEEYFLSVLRYDSDDEDHSNDDDDEYREYITLNDVINSLKLDEDYVSCHSITETKINTYIWDTKSKDYILISRDVNDIQIWGVYNVFSYMGIDLSRYSR